MAFTTYTATTRTLDETRALGVTIAKRMQGTEVFALVSPLGGGKTSFVQGLAEGLGVGSRVISPTFVLEKIYTKKGSQKPTLYHYDLYRVEADALDGLELEEVVGRVPIAIEWADKIKDKLPAETVWVEITAPTHTSRKFSFKFLDDQAYLFK